MFFTKAGLIIAWLLFIPSAASYAIVAVAAVSDNLAAVTEIFGRRFVASTSTFSQGIAIGVAFGIAAEISKTLSVIVGSKHYNTPVEK